MYFRKPEDQAYQILRTWKIKMNGDRSKLQAILSLAGIDISSLDPCTPSSEKLTRKPIICVQPKDQEVIYGQTSRIILQIDNPDSSTVYQWYKNREALQGKTFPELLFHSTIDSDTGDYFCRVTNRIGSVDSNVARLRVVELDRRGGRSTRTPDVWEFVQSQLQSRGVEGGIGLSMPAAVTSQATRSTAATSGEKPRITQQPQPQEVDAGDPLTLTCLATGSTDLKYLWYFNGLSLKDETRPQYCINCFTDEDEGMYQCQVSNSQGTVMSEMVEVKMSSFDSDS